MKNVMSVLLLLFCVGNIDAQDINGERYIEVTGSAELEVEPDEIRFTIVIGEYWEEEFDKNAEYKDYKTKVSINEIQKNLLADLGKLGIKNDDIIIQEIGNYWRYQGRELLISKQFELVLFDFKKIDEIINNVNSKGIDHMRISELRNKKITEFRKQVKIEALKAAKNKADYLLESIGKQAGEIISIEEVDDRSNFWRPQSMLSNTIMPSSNDSGSDNVRKIKLRYEIRAKFEIN